MSSAFNRPPRQSFPSLPPEEIDIPPPPPPGAPPSDNWLIGILPVMGIGVMALFYVWRAAAVRGSSALFAVPLFILAVFAIGGTVAATRWRRRDHHRREDERALAYVRLLEKKRARLQAAHTAQMGILGTAYPSPASALDRALGGASSLWERRPEDEDFLLARVGVGRVPSPVTVTTPDPDTDSPQLARALRVADRYRALDGAPVIVDAGGALGVCGRRDLLLAAARSVLCGLALSHAPTDLQIYVISTSREDWRWARWLPHARRDGRLTLAFDPLAVRELLGDLSSVIDGRTKTARGAVPHLLVVFDGPGLAESEAVYAAILENGAVLGASALCLTPDYASVPGACGAVVEILNNGAFRYRRDSDGSVRGDAVDTMTPTEAAAVARGLASVRLREVGMSGRIPRRVSLLDTYGVGRAAALKRRVGRSWTRPVPDGVLPFPVVIGRESLTTDMTLLLDEDHHGPHGVLAGTTGSGKSELLQTLVCSLALEHDPRFLNFLLVDFKGGSTFSAFEGLPHTVGAVTNLDEVGVERALAALRAETTYRQQFLKAANLRDITQYYRYHAATMEQVNAPDFQPLPHLFVIVDEFAQLAKTMPDFMAELVRTAQVGRSLGLHLILGTQSPMEVVTEEMNANLQFRICLRVQNAEASRAMLRRPDAAYLPAGLAGRGYFTVGERGVYKQFQAAYVGGDYTEDEAGDEGYTLQLVTADGEHIDLLDGPNPVSASPLDAEPYTTAAAVVDVIRDYAEAHGVPYMPPLLLPPLETQVTLEDTFVHMDFGGWDGHGWREPGRDEDGAPIGVGSAPFGLVDDVVTRRQGPLWAHFNDREGGGHLLLMGGPGSGKTTALVTLGLSMAWLHNPDALHIYPLSFGGRGLRVLGNLPHAERAISGTETERVRRLFGRLTALIETRGRSRRGRGGPTVLLLLDGYEGFRDTYYETHMVDFERIITEGRAAGVFVAFTVASVTTVPDRVRSLVSVRVALRLSNTGDYLLAVGEGAGGRDLPAGRGYVPGTPPLACQVSLPLFGGAAVDDEAEASVRRLVNDMRQAFARDGRMQSPAPITELAHMIQLDTLEQAEARPDGLRTTLGQADDDDLSTFTLDWTEHGPHFVVAGPPGGGKTNLLHAAVLAAALAYPPERVRFLLLDLGGRSLAALEPLAHVLARVTDELELETQLGHLSREVTALEALAGRGEQIPRTVLVIDDYEIAADVMSADLAALRQLRDHARMGASAGLHIWAAGYLERVGDPLLKQLLLRRSGFALQERDALHNLNVRVNVPSGMMPPGRAYFAQHNRVQAVQVAYVDHPAAYVSHINAKVWRSASPAAWGEYGGGALPSSPSADPPPAALPDDGGPEIDTAGLIDDLLGE